MSFFAPSSCSWSFFAPPVLLIFLCTAACSCVLFAMLLATGFSLHRRLPQGSLCITRYYWSFLHRWLLLGSLCTAGCSRVFFPLLVAPGFSLHRWLLLGSLCTTGVGKCSYSCRIDPLSLGEERPLFSSVESLIFIIYVFFNARFLFMVQRGCAAVLACFVI